MIYFILWYVIGIISWFVGEKLFEGVITVRSVFYSPITGFGGLVLTIIILAIRFEWDEKIRNFMDKEIL